MVPMRLRRMEAHDRSEVAELICVSLNYWYQMHGMPQPFPGGPSSADVFFDVYETLDPGCGLVVENEQTGRLMGSCFFHPRSTIVHPLGAGEPPLNTCSKTRR